MKNLFLAKSNPRETIIEHTENLLKSYDMLKESYPNLKNINWELLKLACIYHDAGKMNTKFQNKIIKNINKELEKQESEEMLPYLEDFLEDIEEIPHGYLSNAFIPISYLKENFTDEEIKVLYESIFYHHNREKLEGHRKEELLKIIKEDLPQYINDFKYDKFISDEINLNSKFMRYLRKRILTDANILDDETYDIASKLIMTKGLLNKIDFAASSGVLVEVQPGKLKGLTEKSIEPYNLNDLQKYMKEHDNDNLIILASTGIGKTEGALVWIGNNKGFFTLPLRVSINSIYDRVVSKIGYGKDKTALLHSDSASEYMKREEDGIIDKYYLDSTKQLSLPLTICTLDQLIGFIFKYEGFELKLATLSYSKIVIDEIQMYSPDMIAYLVLALRDIVRMGGKFAIVTATFPPIFEYFMNYAGLNRGTEYKVPEKPFLKKLDDKVMLRHKVKIFQVNIDSNIIYNNYKGQKILVIVNTVKTAQKLYYELSKYEDIKDKLFMFHSRYIKEDRAIKEDQIFNDGQLKNKFSGIWITTQVVEASLDIDFDVLFTELSDISGLLQRMGRVYRNRILDKMEANINVFVGDDKLPSGIFDNTSRFDSIIDIDIFNKSKEAILKYNDVELDEEEKMKLVSEVYSVSNLEKSNYFEVIKKTIDTYSDLIPYDLKKNEVKLRNIMSETIIPEVVYEKNKERINETIKELGDTKDFSKRTSLKDELMKKTVTISASMFENIKRKGAAVEKLEVNKYETIYIVPGEYTFEKGFEIQKDFNKFSEKQFG
ncbi:CRISPR-associated helicase/endonuclease Cas3 [Clostridium magnum]|uniref:CRISPR-associated endonuclease/helicase Cas3 n=1 Tax=Clostridium magnum DSM 2767 TaxID=1121326 RepID=A0A162SU61_9CLOT|nr:CRISPR-associated helicase/endonuclease Cas3 [Clostridium magnum]KZL91871.1 CRISPR-associated endonuclease/helicase Cas3 [Clostridium magnum DSM 2767]SHI25471.1 CRISPR-associated helicase, Cas3 family [Clostridium magnum DSM 2767]